MKPNIWRALNEKAKDHLKNSEYAEANRIYSEILAVKPLDIEALFGVGTITQKLKKNDLALSFFSQVIEINNNHEKSFLQRGKIHFLNKNFEDAISDFSSALRINPKNIEAMNSRGITYSQLSNFDPALQDFTGAIQICSSNADLFYNRGLAYWNLGKYTAAICDYTHAIELRPNYYQAFNNRGSAYRELADFEKALEDFKTSTKLKSDFAEGYWNQSLIHLMKEEYGKAWPLYEYRWQSKNFPSEKRDFEEPLWLGEQSIEGKTILVHSEQGFGDTIQFSRYIKLLQNRKCEILMEVEKPLMNLIRGLLPQENIFEKNTPLPSFDFHCPLMSLPLAFGTNLNTIPNAIPYLRPEKHSYLEWQQFLGPKERPRIGIVWKGNPKHVNDDKRSIPIEILITSLCEEFEWFSLQYDITHHEKGIIKSTNKITHFGAAIGDFAKTSAFCECLDAVVCVDTAIAHLAGAIGKEVHLLLPYIADSRWHRDTHKTPWYPTTRIHRQDQTRDWNIVLQNVMIKLQNSYNE